MQLPTHFLHPPPPGSGMMKQGESHGEGGMKAIISFEIQPWTKRSDLRRIEEKGEVALPFLVSRNYFSIAHNFELHLYGFSDPSQDINPLRELDALPN